MMNGACPESFIMFLVVVWVLGVTYVQDKLTV